MSQRIDIALIQSKAATNKIEALEATVVRVAEAAQSGAKIVCLQELFNLPYFCVEQDIEHFDLAEPLTGPTLSSLAEAAAKHSIYLIVPFFEAVEETAFYNSAVVFDPNGNRVLHYRKMHIPQDPGFEEKFYFAPGDLGWPLFDTPWGKMGVLICWDQWFPEAARIMAIQGAKVLFYPTAIGRLASESERLGFSQHQAWETIQRSHGIANGCYVAACNRIGTEGDSIFWGQSFISDFYGSLLAKGSATEEQTVMASLDMDALKEFRRIWPFFRDRRVDAYEILQQRSKTDLTDKGL